MALENLRDDDRVVQDRVRSQAMIILVAQIHRVPALAPTPLLGDR